jgi:hypothetical protein
MERFLTWHISSEFVVVEAAGYAILKSLILIVGKSVSPHLDVS